MSELMILSAIIALLVSCVGIAVCLSDFIDGKLTNKMKNNNYCNKIDE